QSLQGGEGADHLLATVSQVGLDFLGLAYEFAQLLLASGDGCFLRLHPAGGLDHLAVEVGQFLLDGPTLGLQAALTLTIEPEVPLNRRELPLRLPFRHCTAVSRRQ